MLPYDIKRWYRRLRFNRRYRAEVDQARAATSKEELQSLREEWAEIFQALEDERELQFQRRLFRRARRLLVPVPVLTDANSEECWATPGERLLTQVARYELIAEIHKAQKARQELVIGWLPLVTAVTGLIGTIVALVALLRK
jgi:hypothetical protein